MQVGFQRKLHHIKCSVKARYKAAVKDACVTYEEAHFDAVLEHFLNKKIPEFWKCWNAKFRKNVGKQAVVNEFCNDIDFANMFANHLVQYMFRHMLKPLLKIFVVVLSLLKCTPCKFDCDLPKLITVELISKCLDNLLLGKAFGPDDLRAEHLRYTHPLLVVYLK
jgi:hypothetical protein